MAKIYFVRHGESMGNVWAAAYQNDDLNFLSPTGVTQAQLCAQILKSKKIQFKKIITSPMLRARQTTMTILHELDDWHRDIIIIGKLHEKGIHETRDELITRIAPQIRNIIKDIEGDENYLVVTHYHVMQAIIDSIGINRYTMELHGGKTIPNAVPFVFDKYDPTKLKMFDMFKTDTFQF
jgi:broad specificity phosphatase PhoE